MNELENFNAYAKGYHKMTGENHGKNVHFTMIYVHFCRGFLKINNKLRRLMHYND